MFIKEMGFRLGDEAYIENRFSKNVNILYSDDNNKGKTLVIQGMLYALGNSPIFPAGFEYKKAMFYVVCDFKGEEWTFFRKGSSIFTKHKLGISKFDSVSEFKRFFSKNVSPLPVILKDEENKIVDPELFFQIFYLSQDKRNTSSLIGNSYYRKQDFIAMIQAILEEEPLFANIESREELQKKLMAHKSEMDIILRKRKFLKKHPQITKTVLKSVDRESFESDKTRIQELTLRISALEKERLREFNRVSKLQRLTSELLSLNKDLSEGKVFCGDCRGKNIVYKFEEFVFDVSSPLVRKEVLNSIKEQIVLKNEIIEEKTRELNEEQAKLKIFLERKPLEIQTVLLFHDDILNSLNLERDIEVKQIQIDDVLAQINAAKASEELSSKVKNSRIDLILQKMNEYYKLINPNGIQRYDQLFTKIDQTYSGSEEQEFYFSKLISLKDVLEHDFPLIIDSFRDGEISSMREKMMIDVLVGRSHQSILSATLKEEEYSEDKYSNFNVNAINYSKHKDSHILNPNMLSDFKKVQAMFGLQLDQS